MTAFHKRGAQGRRERALLIGRVSLSLRAVGSATLDDMCERFPKESRDDVQKALNACFADGAAWVKYSDDGEIYVAERGAGVGGYAVDGKAFVKEVWQKLKAREPLCLTGRYGRVWNLLKSGPREMESLAKALQSRERAVGVLQALRAVGLILYDGAGNWSRKPGAPVCKTPAQTRGETPTGRLDETPLPTSRRKYERGARVDPPEIWFKERRLVKTTTARAVYNAIRSAGAGGSRPQDVAAMTGLSPGTAKRGCRFLATLGILETRRGGAPGDACDACGYYFEIGGEPIGRVEEWRAEHTTRKSTINRETVIEFLRRVEKGRVSNEIADACGFPLERVQDMMRALQDRGIVRKCGFRQAETGNRQRRALWKLDERYREELLKR